MWDKFPNIANIWGIPQFGDRCSGFWVNCPDYLGYLPVRMRRHGLDWLLTFVAVIYAKNTCPISM